MEGHFSATAYNYIRYNGIKEGFAFIRSSLKSYLFLEPCIKAWADNDGSYLQGNQGAEFFPDPWKALDLILEKCNLIRNDLPCLSGFFSYELCNLIEDLDKPENTLTKLPLYEFNLYRKVIVLSEYGEKEKEVVFEGFDKPFWEATNPNLSKMPESLNVGGAGLDEIEKAIAKYSNFTKDEYLAAVSKVIGHIKNGEVYQANLSQQFDLPQQADALSYFKALCEVSPASYAAFINSGGNFILSASPENFLRFDGKRLSTSPIKGTKLKESEGPADYQALKASEKNLSELTMIVDIERNDLSRVSTADSVRVDEHARVESFKHVHHLVSDISSMPRPGIGLIEIIKAMFPSGSISGAPKIAAMNIIARLEGVPRDIYTGSIGWVDGLGNFEFNVAIRTALITGGRVYYNAGGGIVFDSIPEEEYYETLAKTKGFYLAYNSLRRDN